MNPPTIAAIAGACIFSGALLGMALCKLVAGNQLTPESKDAVKLGAGLISLLAAVVLGLLVSTAKGNFDATSEAVTQVGAKVIMFDRVLAHYGEESKEIRQDLRRGVAAGLELLWPEERSAASRLDAFERFNAMESMLDKIRELRPQTDAQRALHAQAQQLANEILLSRWLQIEQAQLSLPMPFLGVLLFWLTMLYLSFGLVVPRNATVIAVLFIGALSVSTAIFLILEMSDPMGGVIKVSSGPMRKALDTLTR